MAQLQQALTAPTPDERSMAMLVHIIGVFTGFIGPLIFYFIKRDSKFVSFHALQSLFWHLLYMATMIALMALFFVIFFVTIASEVAFHHGPGAPAPVGAFLVFPLFWVAIMVFAVLNLVLAVIFAIKANGGEWTTYPIVGKWARRAVGI
jgi:uncharacterized Tic20 family protein